MKEAIPLYLRVLELQPDDANAREKLATGFVLTNQRDKAVEMLEEIIKEHPEKYQPYRFTCSGARRGSAIASTRESD